MHFKRELIISNNISGCLTRKPLVLRQTLVVWIAFVLCVLCVYNKILVYMLKFN